MFWNFVLRAVQFRKRRLALAFAALAVSATLATALFSVYSDIERKMRVAVPRLRREHRHRTGRRRRDCPAGSRGAGREARRSGRAVHLYRGPRRGEPVVVAGVDFGARRSAYQLLARRWRARRRTGRMPGGQQRGRALPPEAGTEAGTGRRALHDPRHRLHRRRRRYASDPAFCGRGAIGRLARW